MNKSNFVHAAIAIVLQALVFLVTQDPWYGFALAAGIFWSREQDQKQHNIAKQKKCTLNEIKWYEGGEMTKWSKDSLLDFFTPFFATLALGLAITHFI